MSESKLKIPTLISIDTYLKGDPSKSTDLIAPDELDQILKRIQAELGGEIHNGNILYISKETDDIYIKKIDQEDFCVFSIIISAKDDNYISEDWITDITKYSKDMQNIQKILPKHRISNFRIIATAGVKDENMVEVFINEYSAFFNKRINEVGIVYNDCVLTEDDQIENPPFYMKDYVIVPTGYDLDNSKRIISELIDDLSFLSVFEGKLERMYKAYTRIDTKITEMEKRSINMLKTVSNILKQEVTQAILEKYLMRISTQFSEISTMVASISHDSSTVNSDIHNATTIYNKWNEIPYKSYPMVHITSLKDLDVISYAYKSIGDKLEITRGRLHDTLDIIKTYFDLKQQKASLKLQESIEESSKSQESILKATQAEKVASEKSEKSLQFLTYLFAGLGVSEILANFIIFYMEGGAITTTFIFFTLTLAIPLIILAVIIISLRKKLETRIYETEK